MQPFLHIGEESHLIELTITMRDKVTGDETTITGTVKDLVISMQATFDELDSFSPGLPVQANILPAEYRHIGLSGEWVLPKDQDHYYRVTIDKNFEWPKDSGT
jgi:hypothetical protein